MGLPTHVTTVCSGILPRSSCGTEVGLGLLVWGALGEGLIDNAGAQVAIPQASSASWLPLPTTAHVSQRSPVRADLQSDLQECPLQGKDIHHSVN